MNQEGLFGVVVAAGLGFLFLAAWLVYELRRGNVEGLAALLGTWLALSAVTVGVELLAAFILDHTLLFMFGTTAAGIGLVVTGLVVIATPIVWALVIRHRARRLHAAH